MIAYLSVFKWFTHKIVLPICCLLIGLSIGLNISTPKITVFILSAVSIIFCFLWIYVGFLCKLKTDLLILSINKFNINKLRQEQEQQRQNETLLKAAKKTTMKIAVQQAKQLGISPDECLKIVEQQNLQYREMINEEAQRMATKSEENKCKDS